MRRDFLVSAVLSAALALSAAPVVAQSGKGPPPSKPAAAAEGKDAEKKDGDFARSPPTPA